MRLVVVAVLAAVGCPAVLLTGRADPAPPDAGERAAPGWEYKAVGFAGGEKDGTAKLNALARDGWEYVGPLANGLVAFKKATRSGLDADLDKLQGVWVLVSREEGGQVVPAADDGTTFTFTGNRWAWKDQGVLAQAGVWKAAAGDKAGRGYDNLVTEGFNEGGTAKGVYRLDGDTFQYCEGGARPAEFATKAGDGCYLCTWKRAKK